VVNVPVDDEDPGDAVALPSVMSRERDVSEQAEAHPARRERMVAGRPHGAEAAQCAAVEGHVDAVEDAARGSGRRVPAAFAHHRVGVDPAAASNGHRPNRLRITRIVREGDLVRHRVSALDVRQGMKELGILTQRARDRAKPPNVLGMTPARVMTPAIRMRDVRDGHRAPRRRRDVHSSRSDIAATMKRSHVSNDELPRDAAPASPVTGGPSASTSEASGVSSMNGCDCA